MFQSRQFVGQQTAAEVTLAVQCAVRRLVGDEHVDVHVSGEEWGTCALRPRDAVEAETVDFLQPGEEEETKVHTAGLLTVAFFALTIATNSRKKREMRRIAGVLQYHGGGHQHVSGVREVALRVRAVGEEFGRRGGVVIAEDDELVRVGQRAQPRVEGGDFEQRTRLGEVLPHQSNTKGRVLEDKSQGADDHGDQPRRE